MRNTILGSGLIVGLIMMAVGGLLQRTPTFGQEPSIIPVVQRTGELLALSSDAGQGRQQVTVIDSKTRVMSVYHIDHSTGAITLKSVRNIEADLLIDELNTESPLPREIRAMLTNR
jgi:hypothetical protein